MTSSDGVSRALEALAHPYRRQLLLALREHNPQDVRDRDPVNIVTSHEDHEEGRQIELIHAHLPKLDAMGFIEWDRDTGTITRGPQFNEIEPLLSLIHDHQDELPEGWL